MSLLTDILKTEGNKVIKDLRESFQKNKINASGRLSASLQSDVIETDQYIQLTVSGLAYIFTTEEGRGPTINKGDGELFRRILQWIDDKGLKVEEKDKRSVAFAITQKIHREGTRRFRRGGKSGVLSNVLNEKRMNQITDAITNRIVVDIEESIFRVSKNS